MSRCLSFPLWACFSGWLVLGAAAGADLATSAMAQPSPPHNAGGARAGSGSSPVRTGISSPAREEMGGGGNGDGGGDQRRSWVDPLGEGRGVLLPAGYSCPRLRFQSWLRLLQVRRREAVLHRKEGVQGARGEQASATPGARALNRPPFGLFALDRNALHQGATCPRAAEYS